MKPLRKLRQVERLANDIEAGKEYCSGNNCIHKKYPQLKERCEHRYPNTLTYITVHLQQMKLKKMGVLS